MENSKNRINIKNNKGITIIALVITIIILIILAGVCINLVLGENGIITRAKDAANTYTIEQIKEKVRADILDLDIQKIAKGEELTIEQALEGLLAKGTFSEINKEENYGIVDDYIIELTLDENGKVIIGNIEKVTDFKISYTLNPTTYTSGNVEVSLNINAKNYTITKINIPEGMTKKENGNYEITKNGTYTVTVETAQGITKKKDIIVNTIDRLAPKAFTITATSTRTGISIQGQTEDAEATTENACSGIEKYEYYVKKSTDTNYTKYDTNNIEGLGEGTYSIYVIAYDKAGKTTQSNTVTLEKITPPASNYGQGESVNYTANGISDWKIFYKNQQTNETFIITSDYLPTGKIPSGAGMTKTQAYAYWNSNSLPEYSSIIDDATQNIRQRFMMNWNKSTTSNNMKVVSKLLDTNIWSDFVREDLQTKGGAAIGSPTLEMWVASWNDWYPTDPIACNTSSNRGYYVGVGTNSGTSTSADLSSKKGYKNTLYFPHTTRIWENCDGYWIAAPGANSGNDRYVLNIGCGGKIITNSHGTTRLTIRPVICLPSTVNLTYNNQTGMWDVQ